MLNSKNIYQELSTLTEEELIFIASDITQFESIIIESEGVFLSVLNNFNIKFNQELFLNMKTLAIEYALPYIDLKLLPEKSKKHLEKVLVSIAIKGLPKKYIKNETVKLLENIIDDIYTLDYSNKELQELFSEIFGGSQFTTYYNIFNLEDYSDRDKSLDDSSSKIRLLNLIWNQMSTDDKEIVKLNNSAMWVFSNIKAKSQLNDEDKAFFVKNFHCYKGVTIVKDLEYIKSLNLSYKDEIGLIENTIDNSISNSSAKNKVFKELNKSVYKESLKDLSFFFDVGYSMFNDFYEPESLARLVPKDTVKNKDVFISYINSVNYAKGSTKICALWSQLNHDVKDFEGFISDRSVINMFVNNLNKEQKVVGDLVNAFQDVKKPGYAMYQSLINAVIENAHFDIAEGNLTVDKFNKYQLFFEDFSVIFGNSFKSFWIEPVTSDLRDNLKKIHNLYVRFSEVLGSSFEENITKAENIRYQLLLSSIFKNNDVNPNLKELVGFYINMDELKPFEEQYRKANITDNQEILKFLFNDFEVLKVNIKNRVVPALKDLWNIKDTEHYEDKFKVLFNFGMKNSDNFLNLLIENRVPTRSDVLTLMLENLYDKDFNKSEFANSMLNYLKMINDFYPEELSLFNILKLKDYQDSRKENAQVDLSLFITDFDNKVKRAEEDFVNTVVKSKELSERYSDKLLRKYFDEKKYDNFFKMREIISNYFYVNQDPLIEIFDINTDMPALTDLLTDDNRFKQFISILGDSMFKNSSQGYKIKLNTSGTDYLFNWITDFFKRNPELKENYPYEYKMFDIKSANQTLFKKHLIENYPHLFLDRNFIHNIELRKITPKEFVKILLENKDGSFESLKRFCVEYFDVNYDVSKVDKVLKEMKSPKEYALMVSFLNKSIMSKTNFYQDLLDMNKFIEGMQEHKGLVSEWLVYDSFSTVVSLSDENKRTLLLGSAEKGCFIGALKDMSFYLNDEFLVKMSNEDIEQMLTHWNNYKTDTHLLIKEALKRSLMTPSDFYVLKHMEHQVNAFSKCESIENESLSIVKKLILKKHQGFSMVIDEKTSDFHDLWFIGDKKLTEAMLHNTIPDSTPSVKVKARKF